MKTWDAFQRLNVIKRFTGRSTTNHDDVAGHTLRVIMIANRLAEEFPHSGLDKSLIMEMAMVHDIEESLFGDVPSRFKHYLKDYKESAKTAIESEELLPYHLKIAYNMLQTKCLEADVVKMADNLDGFIFVTKERSRGNREIDSWYNKLFLYFESNRSNIQMYYPYVDKVLGELTNEWSNSRISGNDLPNQDLEWGAVRYSDSY